MFLGQDTAGQLNVTPVSIFMPMPDVQPTDTTIYLPQTPIVYPAAAPGTPNAPGTASSPSLGQLTDTAGTYSLPLLILLGLAAWFYMRKK